MEKNFKNYVLFDESYLGSGYFIISELNGVIIKYIKIYTSNNCDYPNYNIRAFERGSVDVVDQHYRDIIIDIEKEEDLFEPLDELSFITNGEPILSIDPYEQGKNQFRVDAKEDVVSLICSKDVFGVKQATDFIDINVGDDKTRRSYLAVYIFFQNLNSICNKKGNDEDIKRILKINYQL